MSSANEVGYRHLETCCCFGEEHQQVETSRTGSVLLRTLQQAVNSTLHTFAVVLTGSTLYLVLDPSTVMSGNISRPSLFPTQVLSHHFVIQDLYTDNKTLDKSRYFLSLIVFS